LYPVNYLIIRQSLNTNGRDLKLRGQSLSIYFVTAVCYNCFAVAIPKETPAIVETVQGSGWIYEFDGK
jgi:hypothetical protein